MQSHRSAVLALTDLPERTMTTHAGLLIEATTDPHSPILETFYAGYDEAFVLPNEKEEYDGFVTCLALNSSEAYPRLVQRYGSFREVVLIAREPAGGEPVGGANFIAFPLHFDREVLSINLNYIFIGPGQRRRGHFKRLVASIGEAAAAFFEPAAAHLPQLVFVEQNDPIQMSPEDYARDTLHAGIDQMQRIRLWAALGAKIIDFPYVQPALSADQVPDETLIYAVLGAHGDALDACLLRVHLLRFFGISVLKGDDPLLNAVAASQLDELAARCLSRAAVPLLTAMSLPSLTEELSGVHKTGRKSLRELIRTPA